MNKWKKDYIKNNNLLDTLSPSGAYDVANQEWKKLVFDANAKKELKVALAKLDKIKVDAEKLKIDISNVEGSTEDAGNTYKYIKNLANEMAKKIMEMSNEKKPE